MLQLSVKSLSLFSFNIDKSQQAPNPSNVLGVFGLSIRTQERDLDEEFSRFGRVEKVTIVYDQRVGSFQGL
jgi:transformer-2 protein